MPNLNTELSPVALTDDQVTKHLRDYYIENDAELKRQSETAKRLALFCDNGEAQISDLADSIFRNPKVRKWRKTFIDIATFQNITRRIIREVSAVYSEFATRRVNGNQDGYAELQRLTHQDRWFRKLNQYTNLCNESLLWFDVDEGTMDPRVYVLTPDKFWAVCHPLDPTRAIGYIVRQVPQLANPDPGMAHYLVMDGDTFFQLDGRGRMVSGSRRPHGLGRLPAILCHRSLPDSSLFDRSTGKDLIAAHLSLALIHTMLLKQQKSGTKQAVAQGDLADMASDQAMDEEHLLQVPDGVTVSVLDMGADPSNYISAANHIIKSVAANWGMPQSVFDLSYQASSGFEIELKRTALREIRRDQILDYRPVEREFAELQSIKLQAAGHPLAFAVDGWRIDFGEVETPRDPMQRLLYWEKKRQMGLTNTVEMYMLENPEASAEDAMAAIVANVEIESRRVEMMRALNIATNASSEQPGRDPEDNGADNDEDQDDG